MTQPKIIADGLEVSKQTMAAIKSVAGQLEKAGIQTITILNDVASRGGRDLIHFDALEIEHMGQSQYKHFTAAKQTLVKALNQVGAAAVDLDPKGLGDGASIAIRSTSVRDR